MIRDCTIAALVTVSALSPERTLGQPTPPPGTAFSAGIQAGGQQLFVLDLAGTPVGEFPTSIKQLAGAMSVVRQGGVPMLKASAASEFLITLPQVLPQDFTLEFDLVPKRGSNPQDLSFEGTPAINQGTGSAHLLWHATGSLSVIGGGGDTYESPMPEALRATLPGVLTHVVADFQGRTVKLYTNGQRHYTLDKQFARGRVLRVFLGGQDDGTEAVYLAGLRISTGSGLGIIAATAGLPARPPAPRPGMPPTPSPAPNPPAGTPPSPPPASPTSTGSTPRVSPGPLPAGTTAGSAMRNAARCTPSAAPGAPPLNYQVGGGRVGGAVLEWWVEANAEYLVERSPDPGGGSRSWTRLTSTCDSPDGMFHFMRLWEDGNSYPAINMTDVYSGVQLGAPYVYRVTVIRPDGTSGSSEAPYMTSGAVFLSSPIAAVNGHDVTLAADISYCTTPSMRCDPWMMEFRVTSSSVGYQYSSRQPWVDSYDPRLPLTVPGGVEGAFAFTISGVPSGTHTFTLTAIYQPDFQIAAGSVTVVVP